VQRDPFQPKEYVIALLISFKKNHFRLKSVYRDVQDDNFFKIDFQGAFHPFLVTIVYLLSVVFKYPVFSSFIVKLKTLSISLLALMEFQKKTFSSKF